MRYRTNRRRGTPRRRSRARRRKGTGASKRRYFVSRGGIRL